MLNNRRALTALSLTLFVLASVSCTRLTPQEQQHYASRSYPLPYAQVFDAVKARVAQYPMGLADADPEKQVVRSRIGGTTPGIGATVGYQITVAVREEGTRTRVTPTWQMNISSEPTKTHLLPTPIDERPLLYMEFFDELDTQLTPPSGQ